METEIKEERKAEREGNCCFMQYETLSSLEEAGAESIKSFKGNSRNKFKGIPDPKWESGKPEVRVKVKPLSCRPLAPPTTTSVPNLSETVPASSSNLELTHMAISFLSQGLKIPWKITKLA